MLCLHAELFRLGEDLDRRTRAGCRYNDQALLERSRDFQCGTNTWILGSGNYRHDRTGRPHDPSRDNKNSACRVECGFE